MNFAQPLKRFLQLWNGHFDNLHLWRAPSQSNSVGKKVKRCGLEQVKSLKRNSLLRNPHTGFRMKTMCLSSSESRGPNITFGWIYREDLQKVERFGDLYPPRPFLPFLFNSSVSSSPVIMADPLKAKLISHLEAVKIIFSQWSTSTLLFQFFVLALILLSLIYNDRFIFVKSRKEIPSMQPSYPLIGNFSWFVRIVNGKIKMIDEFYHHQKTLGKSVKPWTLTGPGLGGRVIVINHPAYIQWLQKTKFETIANGMVWSQAQ